jgi:hypothetical protein
MKGKEERPSSAPVLAWGVIGRLAMCRIRVVTGVGCTALGALLTLGTPLRGEDEREVARAALQRCRSSMQWFEKFALQVITMVRSEGGEPVKCEMMIKRRGACLNLASKLYFLSSKMAERSQKLDVTINEQWGVVVGHEIRKRPVAAIVTAKPEKMLRDHLMVGFFNSFALEGYLNCEGGKNLVEMVLASAEVRAEGRERILGSNCLRIHSRSVYGDIWLWLDEDHGCLIRKYILKRDADSVCIEGQRLREWWKRLDKKGVYATRWLGTLDQVEITAQSRGWLAVRGRFVMQDEWSNGERFSTEYAYRRTYFDPEVELSAEDFQIRLPDGMPVTNLDDPHSGLVYIWRGGRVVPASGELPGPAIGRWPVRSLWVVGFWLILGLVLLVWALYAWRRFRRSEG